MTLKKNGLASGKFLAIDADGIYNILKDFGVKKELI